MLVKLAVSALSSPIICTHVNLRLLSPWGHNWPSMIGILL
jgi:hypothetical protein